MSNPSLLCVPYRFKTSKLYSQIPDSGLGDFVVTRSASNSATRVNAAGFIETVADNVPRLDYPLGGITAGCPSLLVEPSAVNSALRSAELDNAVWTNALWGNWSNATAASSTTIAPDGSTNAEELTFTTGTSSRLQRITGIAASTTYTFSMYVMGKAGNSYQNGIFLRIATGFNNALVATSAATGRVDSTVSNTAWTRYSVTFTTPSSGVNEFNVGITVANSGTNPNATMICWGAQLETGSVATSYIPTTTASVTRNADVVSVSGAVSGSIGQTEGTIYAEVDVMVLGDGRFTTLSDGTLSNRIQCRFNVATNGLDFVVVVSGSSVGFSISNSSHPSFPATIPAGTYKIALGYKQNDYVMAMNGVAYTPTVTTRNVPLNFSKVTLGADVSDLNQFNNRIRAAAIYPTRLTNAQLQSLTQ